LSLAFGSDSGVSINYVKQVNEMPYKCVARCRDLISSPCFWHCERDTTNCFIKIMRKC